MCDVVHIDERRQIATPMWVIVTFYITAPHLVVITEPFGRHTTTEEVKAKRQRERKETEKKNEEIMEREIPG